MKMNTAKIVVFLMVLFYATAGFAQQTYQDWLKQQKAAQDSAINSEKAIYERYKADEARAFQKFSEEQEKAFLEFLQQEWRAVNIAPEKIPDPTPKPREMPQTEPQKTFGNSFPNAFRIEKEIIDKEIELLEPEASEDNSILDFFTGGQEPLKFSFFDVLLQVDFDSDIANATLAEPLSKVAISDFWKALADTKTDSLITQSGRLKQQMQLNDWGFCLLLYEMGDRIFPGSENKRRLFVWFVLTQTGYDARVGYLEDKVYLVLPLAPEIYSTLRLNINNNTYYLANLDGEKTRFTSLMIYSGTFEAATFPLKLNVHRLPAIHKSKMQRSLKFAYNGREHTIEVEYRKDLVDFFYRYPQTSSSLYFQASLSPEAHNSLVKGLRPLIANRPEAEKVDIILSFVQRAFEYETDEVQFGWEKPLFPEETLFYPYSDCEDRAVLFAYLVRNLVGLDVIGLDYPGHISTAVKFSKKISGDFVMYKNEKYVICDPTYIGASIGQAMPEHKDAEVTFIPIGVQPAF